MKIFFLHVNKTGGTTIDWGYLQKIYPVEDRFCQTDCFDKNGYLIKRNVFDELRAECEQGKPFYQSFTGYVKTRVIPDVSLYSGHMPIGGHLAFPNDECIYLTVLRHPVERILSFLNLKAVFHYSSPLKFLHSSGKDFNNWQTRFFCLEGWNKQECNRDMLEEAKTNLKSMIFGITEKMDDFTEKLVDKFGWDLPNKGIVLNKTVEGSSVKCYPRHLYKKKLDITEDTRKIILEKNQLDMELYEWASSELRV